MVAMEADRRFHELLIAASGNGRLARAYAHCHIPLFSVRLGQMHGQIEDFEETEREHRAIVSALKQRDIERAVALLQAHLARGASEVLAPETDKYERPKVRQKRQPRAAANR